ncbi:MAG: hypothetical protein GY851_10105 [bacterium]|nr:hypothetical protein [bacterium]
MYASFRSLASAAIVAAFSMGMFPWICAAAPTGPFVRLATTQLLSDGDTEARLTGTFEGSGENPEHALFDGGRRTASRKGIVVKVADGQQFAVKLAWKQARCVTAVRVAFSGDLEVSFRWADAKGNWHKPSLPAPLAFKRAHPATGYLVWDRLAWNAAEIEVRFDAKSASEITEIEVLGFDSAQDQPFLSMNRDAYLPAVHETVALKLICFNPTNATLPKIRLHVDEYAGEEKVRQAASVTIPSVAPAAAVEVPVTWTTPTAPGRYQLRAHCLATKDDKAICSTNSTVHVTQPKLHMVWYGEPAKAGWTTALTTVSDDLDAYDWQKRGTLPLGWAPGMCRRDDTQADFERDWSSRIESKGRGIAIDEFGLFQTTDFGIGMANALLTVRERFPDTPLYVWQAMETRTPVAAALRRSADLIMHECYMEYLGHRYESFDRMAQRVRDEGLTHNSIFGLACTSEKTSTSAEQLTEQFRYIRELAPELPGVAFYKAYGAGAALAPLADELFERYFLGPVLRVVVERKIPDQVVVCNIGQTTATDVELELVGLPDGVTADKKVIPSLLPGYTRVVKWSLPRSALKKAQVRIVEKPHYQTVSPPKPVR